MKSLKFKAGIFIIVAIVAIVAILAVIFLQTRDSFKSSSVLKSGFDFLNIFGNTATATTSFSDPSASLIKKLAKIKTNKNTKKQTKNGNSIIKSETNTKEMPFGVNNPFSYEDIDILGQNCLKTKSVFIPANQFGKKYSETHIDEAELRKCLSFFTNYMSGIKDIGMNVLSQHFVRRYDEDGYPYFGAEGREDHEIAIQMYMNEFGNYFWMVVNPLSTKGFAGDIDIETQQALTNDNISAKNIYLPASEAGFAEWQKWLEATFDYVNDHNATKKLAYIQIGNESDSDYAKTDNADKNNREDFYWSSYAKLVEKSYDLIKLRSPKTKVVIGAMPASGVAIDGFQKPTLEYLAGKINSNGIAVNENKKCGGTGCFDAYDYHDFSGFKEYKGRTACLPRNCVNAILTVEKTPEKMKKMLNDSGFFDKKLVIQQGGTYTGQDDKVNNLAEYQSEEDQASYLVKRGLYLFANGVEQIQFGTYIEHSCQKDTIHNWFTMMGFVYNGIPEKGVKNCGEKERKENFNKKNCDGQLPCPDPGKGTKKLSYFSAKKIIDIFNIVKTDKIEQVPSGRDDVLIYKAFGKNGNRVYFAWWDWWKICPRVNLSKPEMDNVCLDNNRPTVSLETENDAEEVKTEEIVPNQINGKLTSSVEYKKAFKASLEQAKDGVVAIKLGTKPIFIEIKEEKSRTSSSERPRAGTSKTTIKSISQQLPFGISNPYSQKEKDADVKAKLPEVLKDMGLSKDGNGIAGFLVDEIARKHLEVVCNDTTCQKYDFSLTKDLIDLAVGQGKVNLWLVLNAPSGYRFTDGKVRNDGETYLPDGPISRQAHKDYLTALVNYVNTYGRKVSGNSGWYVINWNLSNEVYSEYREVFGKDDKATTAYTNFVIDSSEILRKLSPQSKIVLAGAGSTTNLATGHGEFYRQVFSNLKKTNLGYEPFDYWESHWFGRTGNYKTNESVNPYGVKDFIQFLNDNGYGDKGFVIRAGATYSGQNTQERKGFMDNYQSEQDQASFLVKRFVYNLGAGVKYIPWSTIYERNKYQGETNVHFQYISLIYDGYPDGVSKNQKCVKGWLPCPDPGMGVKKLSYYSYKKLIEVLKGSDWNNIQIVQEKDDVYVYKFIKNGKPVWVAWNDNIAEKQITISGITSSQVKITEAIPKYESGKEVKNYNNDFGVLAEKVLNGKVAVKLGTKPIYIE